ncbi:hypothetical protein QQG55_52020 [Brugia pahangi]
MNLLLLHGSSDTVISMDTIAIFFVGTDNDLIINQCSPNELACFRAIIDKQSQSHTIYGCIDIFNIKCSSSFNLYKTNKTFLKRNDISQIIQIENNYHCCTANLCNSNVKNNRNQMIMHNEMSEKSLLDFNYLMTDHQQWIKYRQRKKRNNFIFALCFINFIAIFLFTVAFLHGTCHLPSPI